MGYKDLEVWQQGRRIVALAYRMTESYPQSETFGLVSQIRRAAVSIPTNIAEGYGRRLPGDYVRFLRIAKGSVNELETLFILSEDLGLVADLEQFYRDLAKVGSMLTNLMRRIESGAASVESETVVMYRPVGPEELAKLEEADFTKWPPRLPEQPIFYPVTNERYARDIAEKWNVRDSGSGYITRFRVPRAFAENYPIECVGASHHTEWWIPAEDVELLNQNLVGRIEVIATFGAEPTPNLQTP